MYNIKYFYDLHIHSVLSPDADDFMTPNNILNMCMLKELDFVSITDHNSAKQLKVVAEIEKAYDFVFIPGIEVTVLEGFDVLCYFRTYEDAYELDSFLEKHLNGSWGTFTEKDQMITDLYDNTINTFPTSLQSTSIPYFDLYAKVKHLNGAVVLAHIDRKNKSALNSFNLDDIPFDGIEIQQYFKEEYLNNHSHLKTHNIFASSDSHTLLSILERVESIEIQEKTRDAFFKYLLGGE